MRVLALSLIILIAGCCVCDNGYRAIKDSTDADAKRYAEARDYISKLHDRRCSEGDLAPCAITIAVWNTWLERRDEYLRADGAFSLVLNYLRDTGVRAANFDALHTNLQRAVNQMVALEDGVRNPPGVPVNTP